MLFHFIILLIFFSAGYLYYSNRNKPIRIIPLPYKFSDNIKWEGQEQAEKAQVLFIGDKYSTHFEQYFEDWSKSLSENLKSPLKLYNWGGKGEGLHRSLAKLKSLKKWPPVIFLMTGSEEFVEKRFHLRELKKISFNYKLYDDNRSLSLIMAAPFTSKFLYLLSDQMVFEQKIKPDKTLIPDIDRFKYYKYLYKTLEMELTEIINLVKENEGNLVLITPPINLEIPPKQDCDQATTVTVIQSIEDAKELMSSGDYKRAYNQLKTFSDAAMANANLWHYYGKAALELGKFQEAKDALLKSTAFDCILWRSNGVINSIIKDTGIKNGARLLDFHGIVNRKIGRDHVFMDETKPQEIYYQELTSEIKETIRSILQI